MQRLLGPSAGRVLGEVPRMVDEIYIQFYNNWCHTGNKRVFWDHVKKWLEFSRKTNGPRIFVGVPGNTKASGNAQHYRTPKELEEIYNVSSILYRLQKKTRYVLWPVYSF